MTEKQLRKHLVDTAISYLGCKESNGTHKKIIDLYNSHTPLANGYKVKYTDEWCSTFASAVAIKAGLTSIIPTECGCERHINLFKNMGCWVENDAYVPDAGDYIFYDWQDTGVGDNKGHSDHVGIVVSVTGDRIKIIEGNISESVGYRVIDVNGKFIRGYGVPKYSEKAKGYAVEDKSGLPYVVGDIVNFAGNKHYLSSTALNGSTCRPGKARITAISRTGTHKVHLVAVKGGLSNVYGWVDDTTITREIDNLVVGATVKVNPGAKTYTGGNLSSHVYSSQYEVMQIDGDRAVIGKNKRVTAAVKKKDLTVL